MEAENPVFQDEDGKWWFWDQSWTKKYGPYDSEHSLAISLYTYCLYELGIPKEEMESYEPTRQNQKELDNQGHGNPFEV